MKPGKAPRRPAGGDSLTKYRAHGSGIELFRAYVERRRADKATNLERKRQVLATLTPSPGCGVSSEAYEQAASELVVIQILEELDPVIKDLLKFCTTTKKYSQDEQLVQLRAALRIGDTKAPDDAARIERKWKVQQAWIDAYLEMQKSLKFRSQNAIAKEIANECGVSQSSAIQHWNAFKKTLPHQASWTERIEKLLRPPKKTAKKERATPKNKSARPDRKRLDFGKGTKSV